MCRESESPSPCYNLHVDCGAAGSMPECEFGGRGFEPRRSAYTARSSNGSGYRTLNPEILGSNPVRVIMLRSNNGNYVAYNDSIQLEAIEN